MLGAWDDTKEQDKSILCDQTWPWIIYVLCLIFPLPKWGFMQSLTVGVLTYMILAGIVSIVMKHLGRG